MNESRWREAHPVDLKRGGAFLMYKLLTLTTLAAATLSGQYKTEPAGAPPSDLSPSVQTLLVKDGTKILKADGSVLCEVWMRATEPTGGSKEENSTFTTFPHGALIGAIRFPARHSDRRGQTIKPGVYTMRHSLFPINGDHQGVSPQRDFLILSLATDTDGAASLATWRRRRIRGQCPRQHCLAGICGVRRATALAGDSAAGQG